jgi:preprotein translocase subunit SecA
MHVEVMVEPAPEPDLSKAFYEAAESPVQGSSGVSRALAAEAAANPELAQQMAEMAEVDDTPMAPVVKEDRERVGRNDPCWCGSGKKFKFCHGR